MPLQVNFGRGGLKEFVEEEGSRHVRTMHYAATSGIRVGKENMNTSRWLDPVDDKTSFPEVVCDNYEALVDEKRKRTGEDDGGSKRHNTRNERKE